MFKKLLNSTTRDFIDFVKNKHTLLWENNVTCLHLNRNRILMSQKTYYPPTLADNLSPIGSETPRVDGSVSPVDRKFFCIYTHIKKNILPNCILKCSISMSLYLILNY